ncbi:MAG: Gfo/Idh/MocA family oxidoreductase, partial [Candidatus Omnitrophica bacterium]|nr:Gfo/Idh/MocA family oxidoreductase [Candidatus Omnitrophota bacterium]
MNSLNIMVHRRRFLKASAALAAVSALPAWFVEESRSYAAPAKPLSPNDKPGIALVGCGGQGTGDCNWASNFGNVIAVCDLDEKHLETAATHFKAPHKYRDFRQVMERDDVHVIITGTPDHWHTMVNLAAVKAGKDIYSEKPLTLAIDEGKRLVAAVKEHGTVFQTGSQQRSDPRFRLACELVRNGRVGKLQQIYSVLPTGPREGPFDPLPVPFELNWDFYLGQAPYFAYNGHNAHFNFRWWYRFSGGMMTDWGAHHDDIAQWGNGTERSGPVEVEGKSLIDMIPGGYNTAARYEVNFKYANGVRLTVLDDQTHHLENGVKFEGTEGWIFVNREKIQASKPELLDEPLPSGAIRLYKSDNHMG